MEILYNLIGTIIGTIIGAVGMAWRVARNTGATMRAVILRGGGNGEER